MSKDGTNRGGARPGAGRKPKAISEKIASGNPGGRKLTVVDFGDEAINLKGSDMPPVKDHLKARQKDGSTTCAEAIYKETWEWLHERKCDHLVPVQQIEQYAMSVARWIQCEESPLLTAEWEHCLNEIQHDELPPGAFIIGIKGMVQNMIASYEPVPGSEVLFPSQRKSVGKCPRCSHDVVENTHGFFCSSDTCKFALWNPFESTSLTKNRKK